MDAIIKFFTGIGSAIQSVIDFVMSLFQDLVFVVKLLGKFLVSIPDYFGWMPVSVVGIVMVIISVAVVYKILGREG